MADKFRKELSLGLAALALLVSLTLGLPLLLNAQLDTRDLISNPGFWPTQTKYPINDYAGPQACAQCHGQIATQQRSTSMAQTAMRASNSPLLAANPLLRFRAGVYDYEIRTTGGHSTYTVWDGKRSESKPLVWAFGTDRIAQSFLFKKDDGAYYEARVTHFRSLGELDFTPGRALTHAADMNEAMDREVGAAEIGRCFGCHTTGAGAGASFDEARLIPGVTCEACHGPGRGHVAEMKDVPLGDAAAAHAQSTPDRIFNPKTLTPEQSVDFCGSCHGSYWDITLSGSSGPGNVRFQPYRLEQSKCWNKEDARLTCVACHNPHQEIDTNTSSYDHVCLSCHLNGKTSATGHPRAEPPAESPLGRASPNQPATSHPAMASGSPVVVAAATHAHSICPVATKNCTSCHMPQVYVPAMHRSFPDHRIRIAREREIFPD
jgi:hypothetical protein